MENRAKEAIDSQSQKSYASIDTRSKPLYNGIEGNNTNSTYWGKETEQERDKNYSRHPTFPLANVLSRRLSNMSNFSSTSSSLDGTSSDDNGIADNEEDSGEASTSLFDPMHNSSAYGMSRNIKSIGVNKKKLMSTSRSNRKTNISKLRMEYEVSRSERHNFKTIQKDIDDILKSDILLNEDLDKKESNKSDESDDDDYSKDNTKTKSYKESSVGSSCSKKKAKALINCFRSFAVKPT